MKSGHAISAMSRAPSEGDGTLPSNARVLKLRRKIIQPEPTTPSVRLLHERPIVDDGLTCALLVRMHDCGQKCTFGGARRLIFSDVQNTYRAGRHSPHVESGRPPNV